MGKIFVIGAGRSASTLIRYLLQNAEAQSWEIRVGDINIGQLLAFHQAQGLQATLTATYPPGRFGAIDISADNRVSQFKEKPKGDGGLINGGFFVLSPSVIGLIDGDDTLWEREPLEALAAQGQLAAYRHEGFWQPMDTLRDKIHLEQLWQDNTAPWKVWS